ERVRAGQAGQLRRPLVDLRVVLHRARAERIEPEIDGVVQVRQAVEVPEQVELTHLREAWRTLATDRCGQLRLPGGGLARLGRWRREAYGTPLGARGVEDERLDDRQVVAGLGAG